MTQVLINLVGNAIKFTDAGRRLPELYVTFGDRLNVLPLIDLGAWISEIGMRVHRPRSSLGNPSVV